MPKTPGHHVQDKMEMYRGPQKQPRPQVISKTKFIRKSPRGK